MTFSVQITIADHVTLHIRSLIHHIVQNAPQSCFSNSARQVNVSILLINLFSGNVQEDNFQTVRFLFNVICKHQVIYMNTEFLSMPRFVNTHSQNSGSTNSPYTLALNIGLYVCDEASNLGKWRNISILLGSFLYSCVLQAELRILVT